MNRRETRYSYAPRETHYSYTPVCEASLREASRKVEHQQCQKCKQEPETTRDTNRALSLDSMDIKEALLFVGIGVFLVLAADLVYNLASSNRRALAQPVMIDGKAYIPM